MMVWFGFYLLGDKKKKTQKPNLSRGKKKKKTKSQIDKIGFQNSQTKLILWMLKTKLIWSV